MIDATTSAADAHQRIWDAIVVGAGPAGAVTALGLAQTGLRALLVDHSNFPREKVCGGCLNADAVSGIRKLGLGPQLDALGGVLLNRFCLSAGRQRVSLELQADGPLQAGVAVSRGKLDAMLVEAAIAAGANFLPNVRIRVSGGDEQAGVRQVICSDTDASIMLQSRTVVVATGLSADLQVDDPELAMRQSPQSRIGARTIATSYPDHYAPGTIFMAVSRFGYVGLTRTEGNLLNIAAALEVKAVRETCPSAVCERILTDAGFPVSSKMLSGAWRGTIGLTRRRRKLASYRLFVVGDAAGYVEPFTGEGMAWAIHGGRAVVPFVEKAVNGWSPSLVGEWSQTLRMLVTGRQRLCRTFARILRHPMLARWAIRIVATIPAIGRAVIRRLNKGNRDEFFDSGAGHGRAA
jgi:flavin-dependent dehydrogenase